MATVKIFFQTSPEYSIAHYISTDLKMSKSLTAQIKKKYENASGQLYK